MRKQTVTMLRQAVALTSLTWLLLVPTGCIDFYGSREWEARAAAQQPYYGTGVVTNVRIHPKGYRIAAINFGSFSPPPSSAKLLIMRTNSIVGKVQTGWGYNEALILEGRPKIGDLAVGWQREADLTPPQSRMRQRWEKLP